jgi:2'-hydroxyisoflavone reductase
MQTASSRGDRNGSLTCADAPLERVCERAPVKLLVIGGARFSGRALTGFALDRGHDVTVFHRGSGPDDPWPEAEHVHGDRNGGLGLLEGRGFDVLVDTCGYVPRDVRASGAALPDVGLYAFVSSLSVHVDGVRPRATEDDDVYEPPFPETEEITDLTYGPLKVACEQEVRRTFGDRALVVRPGLIVGPYDPTDRFTYWVRRVATGGEVLAPAPSDASVQWIDARDLAAFVLRLCERLRGGTYSVVTPAGTQTMGGLLQTCRAVSGSDAQITWVPETFLDEHGVQAWSDLPVWLPTEPGFMLIDPSRAIAAGLTFRSIEETVRDTLAWDLAREQTRPIGAGLAPERERELLVSWHGTGRP